MRTRSWAWAALLCLLALATTSQAADKAAEPGLVIKIKSIDGFLTDGKYLAKVIGHPEAIEQAEAFLKNQAGEKGFKAFDRTKPIGLYGTVGAAQFGLDSTFVAMLPVKSEEAVLALLEDKGLKAEKGDDGVYTVTLPNLPAPGYFRFANHYAYVTGLNKNALDKENLLAPSDILSADENSLVSMTFRIDRVPEEHRKLALEELDKKLDEAKEERKPNESDGEHQVKVEVLREMGDLAKALIMEGRAVKARADVDRTANQLVVEASLDAKPGSGLAGRLERLAQRKSLFANLAAKDGAFNMLLHFKAPEQSLKSLSEALDEGVKKELAKQPDQQKREQAEKALKALMPTLKSGELDAGLSLRGPAGAGKTYTAVAGIKVKDGEQLDKTFRQLVEGLPADKKKDVHLDAAKVGDVSVHRIDVSGDLDANSKKAFGEHAAAYLAFRPDGAVIALGTDAMGALKEALAAQPEAGPPLLMDANVKRLAPLMEKDNPGAVKAAQEAFTQPKEDHYSLTAEGGKALKVSLRLNAQVLHFLSLLQEAKKGSEKP
jgi:hypothetical protein